MESWQIKEIIQREGLTSAAFAEAVGLSTAIVSQMATGKRTITAQSEDRIREAFPHVSSEWIACGSGPYLADVPMGARADTVNSEDLFTYHARRDAGREEPTIDSGQPSRKQELPKKNKEEKFFSREEKKLNKEKLSGNREELPGDRELEAVYPQEPAGWGGEHGTGATAGRRIVEIKVFYDDGTYETYRR